MKVSNKACRPCVQARTEFDGSQLYGRCLGEAYVVYSYGPHFPLFAYIDGTWYENTDFYSRSTSKQKSQAHPLGSTEKCTLAELKALIKPYL